MRQQFYSRVAGELDAIERDGLTKPERVIGSRQGATVEVERPGGGRIEALNLCANNYLGLAGDPRVAEAAAEAARAAGAGMASVRFICGTHAMHKALEAATADVLGYEEAILFAAAFDANAGVFEPLLGEGDVVVSDSLNHASIIDGVRLCKADRRRFANGDMDALERELKAARSGGARTILIATDGVFSMDGHIAKLDEITGLADRYDALVLVDDCHATGVLGAGGRGSASHRKVDGRIDILTGTYGKALGGAMGGFVAARRPVVELLRQRARPYLFSNALPPTICGAALAAIEISKGPEGDDLRARLSANTRRWRTALSDADFDLISGEHPIVPVMLGDARVAQQFASGLLARGVLVTGFSYPVVPKDRARIRTQLSAALTPPQIDAAARAFIAVREAIAARAPTL